MAAKPLPPPADVAALLRSLADRVEHGDLAWGSRVYEQIARALDVEEMQRELDLNETDAALVHDEIAAARAARRAV
jgi:hypothetical protein